MKRVLFFTFLFFLFGDVSAENIPIAREVYEPDFSRGPRQPVAERIFLYPEIQYKYGLFQNFLDEYIDRPLFYDRATRYKNQFSYMTKESFFREIPIEKNYGFDGGGSLASGIFKLYQEVNHFLDAEPERAGKYVEFPQFSYGESGRFHIRPEQTVRVLELALQSKFAPRIKGRIPVSTYNSQGIDPKVMKEYLQALKKRFGDTFAVCGNFSVGPDDFQEYVKNGRWSPEMQDSYRKKLRSILAVFDGVQVRPCENRRTFDYMFAPDTDVWTRYLIPMIQEEMAKPENRDKLICGSVSHGYINHMSGVTHGEFGTARARKTLDALFKLNCDLIFFFEWNEFNENTCWQPTLYNSLVLQRLVRFYAHRMSDEKPAPNPGDDQTLPPFALSYRDHFKAGEPIEFELLNIPDTEQSEPYSARLILKSADGKILVEFPEEKFDRARMRAVTFRVPSEKLARHTVLLPELIVGTRRGKSPVKIDNLQYIHLLPTVCFNYKTVRQSLRDLLFPEKVIFKISGEEKNHYRVSAALEAGEKLASLEVLDWGQELHAVDPSREFDHKKDMVIVGTLTAPKGGAQEIHWTLSGANHWGFREWGLPNVTLGRDWRRKGNEITGQFRLWKGRNRFILTLPKADAGKAVLSAKIGEETKLFRIADLIRYGKMAHAYPKSRLELENYNRLPDIPPRIDQNSATLEATVRSTHDYPVFQLRAITESGKIYRSRPVLPQTNPSKMEKLNVFSETTGRVVETDVPTALVPRLNWILDPAAGDLLRTEFDPYFDAGLGGGYGYCDGYHEIQPPPGRNAPCFGTEDGKNVLKFDGTSYIHFPLETFPRGAFTLRFEVKPEPAESTKSYVLFRHFSRILGSVTLFTKFDRLVFAFGDRTLKTHLFSTSLDLPPGKWSKVQVSYDLKKVRLEVNGKTNEFELPAALALYFKPAIFGGHTKAEFGLPSDSEMFKGKLRSISIIHNTEI